MPKRGLTAAIIAGVSLFYAAPVSAQTVTWVTPPPVAVQGGGQFTVQWMVQDFTGALTGNAVAWGINSLLGQTTDQLDGNCLYTAVVNVPAVGTSGTLYYAAFAQNATEFAYTSPIPVLITTAPAAATYFPIRRGSAWEYVEDGLYYFTTVVNPLLATTGCVPTAVFEDLDLHYREFFSLAPDGPQLHRQEFPLPGGIQSYTFDPPIHLAAATLVAGQATNSSGTATFVSPATGTQTFSYASTATVEAFESLTVPAGTFTAARVHLTVSFDGTPVNDLTLWYVPDVGRVKTILPGPVTQELVGSNLLP